MQIHKLTQGSAQWHSFRMNHYGASEAAAMLGLSKYLSRNELLEQKATGKSKEYSTFVQERILDNGHLVEALAREIIEAELEDDLFPVTCSDGDKSASCDGLTMDGRIAFEHKSYNRESFGLVQNGEVPEHHMPQCQQILMITGAEKLIFTVSDGTEENMATVEVLPDLYWFNRLNSGWEQFKKDLSEYHPRELVDKPEPNAIMQLPTLSIQIKGEVTVSNLPEFKHAAEKFIAGINTDLKTDNDFANAEATVKYCVETEDKLENAKAAAIGQTASIDELMRTIDHIKESIRQKRLKLEKSVKTQKESIKNGIIEDGFVLCEKHVDAIHDEFKNISFGALARTVGNRHSIEQACKGKRTLASLHNAVDTEVASIKIKLDDLARVIRKNLIHLPEDLSLFRDLQSIITKPQDDFKLLVESRLAEQKRKEHEAAQRAVAESKAAEERKQSELADAEERGRAQNAAMAEREKLAAENEAKRLLEDKLAEAKRLEQEAIAKAEMEEKVAEFKLKEQTSKTSDLVRDKDTLNEIIQSFMDNSFPEQTSIELVKLIAAGKIKHVAIIPDQPSNVYAV